MGGKKVFDCEVQVVSPCPTDVQNMNGKFTREYAKALKSGIPSISAIDSNSSKPAEKVQIVTEVSKKNHKKSEFNGKATSTNKPSAPKKGNGLNASKRSKSGKENEKMDKTGNPLPISNPAQVKDVIEPIVTETKPANVENVKSDSEPIPKPHQEVTATPATATSNNPIHVAVNNQSHQPITSPNGVESSPVNSPPVILDPNAREFTPPLPLPHPSVFFPNHPYNVHTQPHPHPHSHSHPLPHSHALPPPHQMHFRGLEMQPIMYGPHESYSPGVIPVFAPGPQYPVMYSPLSPSPHPPIPHSSVSFSISQPSLSSSVSNNPSLPVPSLPLPSVSFVPSPYPPITNSSSPSSSPVPSPSPAPYPLSPSPSIPVPLPHAVVSAPVLTKPPETTQPMASIDMAISSSDNGIIASIESPSPESTEQSLNLNSNLSAPSLPNGIPSPSPILTSTVEINPAGSMPLSSSIPASVQPPPSYSPSMPLTPYPMQPHYYDQSHMPMVMSHESSMQMMPPGNRMMMNHGGNFPPRPSFGSVRPILPGMLPVFYPPFMPGQQYLGRENFSRILLLHNVRSDTSNDQIEAELETYGRIRYLDLERKNEGILIVHYFDLRDARKLYYEIQKKFNNNNHINNNNNNVNDSNNYENNEALNEKDKNQNEFLTQNFDENFPEISSTKPKKKENENVTVSKPTEESQKVKVKLSEKESFLHSNLFAQFLFFINNNNKNNNINFQNQGTIVLFNVDNEVSNEDLKKMFGEFGLIKEIREITGKRQKFIEYYDTRDSEKAMDFYDGKEINGKKIKIEFSKPSTSQRRRQNSIPSLNTYPLTASNTYPSPSHSSHAPFSPYPPEPIPPQKNSNFVQGKKQEKVVLEVEDSEKEGLNEGNLEKEKEECREEEKEKDVAKIKENEDDSHSKKKVKNEINMDEEKKEEEKEEEEDNKLLHNKIESNTMDVKTDEQNYAMIDNRYDNYYPVSQNYSIPNFSSFSQNPNFFPYSHPRQPYYFNPNGTNPFPGMDPASNHFGFPYPKFDESQGDTSAKSDSFANRKNLILNLNSRADGKNFRRKIFSNGGGNGRESELMIEKEDQYMPRNPRPNTNLHMKRVYTNLHGSEELTSQYTFDEFELEYNEQKSLRTTLMIKNIPNKYSQGMLLALLDSHCLKCNSQPLLHGESLSAYDFVYLPIDFKNRCNLGYAFVNFTSVEATLKLYRAFHAQQWEAFNSRKICQVTYARVQGRPALEEHFRNSRFACDTDEYLPLIFSPPRNGIVCPPPIVAAGHLAGRTAGTSPSYTTFRRNLANQTFGSLQSDAAVDSDELSEVTLSDSPCKVSEPSMLESSEALKVEAF